MGKDAGRMVMSKQQQVHNISFMVVWSFHVLAHAVTFWQPEYKAVGNKC